MILVSNLQEIPPAKCIFMNEALERQPCDIDCKLHRK